MWKVKWLMWMLNCWVLVSKNEFNNIWHGLRIHIFRKKKKKLMILRIKYNPLFWPWNWHSKRARKFGELVGLPQWGNIINLEGTMTAKHLIIIWDFIFLIQRPQEFGKMPLSYTPFIFSSFLPFYIYSPILIMFGFGIATKCCIS